MTNGTLPLPINGFNAFNLTDKTYHEFSSANTQRLNVNASASAAVVSCSSFGLNMACALVPGKTIGPADHFKAGAVLMESFTSALGSGRFYGQFGGTTNRFLGLKFTINGRTHYGWARFAVVTFSLTAVLTGIAYETIPDKPIIAVPPVEASDDASLRAPSPEPATLGLLALGAPALSLWRRKERD